MKLLSLSNLELQVAAWKRDQMVLLDREKVT